MSKAVRLHETGGVEKLRYEDVPTPSPKRGEALIAQEAIGLNFIDVYFRNGLYKLPKFPAVIGMEGAGIVLGLGPDTSGLSIGDRVAYAGSLGAYAQRRVIAADRLVVLPDTIDFETAAAMMLQGMTARYLLRQTHLVVSGETILVYAAAGGVGLILCQWAKHLGATVIGVVSTPEKAALAAAHGADHLLIGTDGVADAVKRITQGAMVPVVYDGTGAETFSASLDCLAPRGLMVSYGNSTGEVTGVDLALLARKGSLYVTRPTLATYIAARDDLVAAAAELFDVVQTGAVKIRIGQRFALADVRNAHEALEQRRTTGSTILLP